MEKTEAQMIREDHVKRAMSARERVLKPGIGGRDPYLISVQEHLKQLPKDVESSQEEDA